MSRRPAERSAPSECPVCGADVPPRASACPHCGADERTGWNDNDARYDGLDLPDSAYGDEDAPPARRPLRTGTGIHPLWWLVALALLALFLKWTLYPLLG